MNTSLAQLVIHHPIFKIENSHLILDNSADMDYSMVNQYEPINLPSIVSAIISYVDVHDLLKLVMLSKSFRLTIKKEEFKIQSSVENILKNAADHQCLKCVKLLYTIDHVDILFLSCCQTGNPDIYNIVKLHFQIIIHYDPITLHQCIKGLLKIEPTMGKKLFKEISHISIKNIETLLLIVKTNDEYYIKKVCQVISLTSESFKILLPYFCQYDLKYKLALNIDLINNELDYLYELMQNKYTDYVMVTLFNKLLLENYDFKDIVYWTNLYCNQPILELVLTNYNDQDLTPLIPKAYQFDLQCYFSLDHNKAENLLSIELSSKYTLYNPRTIYTSYLSVEEMIDQLLLVSNKYVKYELITHIAKKIDQSTDIIALIDWIANNEVKEGLVLMDKISDDLKFKLVSLAYKHNQSESLTFLKNSKKYNLLSVQEADKHYTNNYIYVNRLNNEDLLKLLVKVQNKFIKKILIYHIKSYLVKTTKNHPNPTLYKLKRTNDHDYKEEFYYKLKINTSNLEKIQQCIEMDDQTYYEIFTEVVEFIGSRTECTDDLLFYNGNQIHIIQWLIQHPLFKQTNDSIMFKILKRYPSNVSIINCLLEHPFFDTYKTL